MKRFEGESSSASSKKTKAQPMDFSQSKLVIPARSSQERRESTSDELKRLIEPPKNIETIVLSSDDEEDIIMQKDALKKSLKAPSNTITSPTPNLEGSTTFDNKNATASTQQEIVKTVGSRKGKEKEVVAESSEDAGTAMIQYIPPATSNVVDVNMDKVEAEVDDNTQYSRTKSPSSSTIASDDFSEVDELQSDSEDEVQGSSLKPSTTAFKKNPVTTGGSSVTHKRVEPVQADRKTTTITRLAMNVGQVNITTPTAADSIDSSDSEYEVYEDYEDYEDYEEDSPVQREPTTVVRHNESHQDEFTPSSSSRDSLAVRSDLKTGFVFDISMTHHAPLDPREDHPEKPERLFFIFAAIDNAGLLKKLKRIGKRKATKKELLLAHNRLYINELEELDDEDVTIETIQTLETKYANESLYFNALSYNAAVLASGSLINLMEAVITNEIKNGFAIIRPPGHHAEQDMPMGFCLFNNVAIAVKSCMKTLDVKRVLIVDWDVHFGNGTQDVFDNYSNVLYISIHRFEDGTFYPMKKKGSADYVGSAEGQGYTVNIPWSCSGVTDTDYLFAFEQVVMPIAREFAPELVVVSAGFDAAEGDPLGECLVSPGGYSNLTHTLKDLAGGKVVMALEGGYNLKSTAVSALASMQVLMGETPTPLGPLSPSPACLQTIEEVKKVQKKYWSCFD